jgi:hypothetical protein
MRIILLSAILALGLVPVTPSHAQEPPPVTARADSAAVRMAAAVQAEEGRKDGVALAAKQGGWFGRAYLAGFAGNLIGAAIILPLASGSEPLPPKDERPRIAARGEPYAAAFEQAYITEMRRKRVRTSAFGVALGTATIFTLFLGIWD